MGITNENAGIKVTETANFKRKLGSLVGETMRSEVLSEMGSFCSLFALPGGYAEPVLASAIECVGAKCDFLSNLGRIEGLGQDVVAAGVNDLITSGAHPLFFLDYISTEEFDENIVEELVKSIARACREIGCALVGGETAQMPGVYAPGHFDLAGSVVGVVERKKMLGAYKVRDGDQILGLSSNGLHSSGFHMVKAILGTNQKDEIEKIGSTLDFDLIEELVRPTRIYVKEMDAISGLTGVHAAANITCGGLWQNIKRIVPSELIASIETDAMEIPAIFNWLAERGEVSEDEMYKSFNMGVGFVVIASYSAVDTLIDEGFTLLGDITSRSHLETGE